MEAILNDTLTFLKSIMAIPSPSGYTSNCIHEVKETIDNLGFQTTMTNKDALIITIPGKDQSQHKLITAHVDTLGAMVKEVKDNGRLRLTPIGGFAWGAYEGETATIHTFSNKTYTGTLLPNKASVHIYGDEVREAPRQSDTVEIRLDEVTTSKEETLNLGISVGNFVSFDPRFTVLENGFIKSRYLDDKASVAILMALCKFIQTNQLTPDYTTHFYISNNEEIGHGVSVIPPHTNEMIALDIGIVGKCQESDEYSISIAAKDSRSPYDFGLNRKLIHLCQKNKIPYNVDIYDKYGSDASTSILQGADVKSACIGPGVDATHHYERCHIDSLKSTIMLLGYYLFNENDLNKHWSK
jgi:aminopeptidase